MAQCVQQTAKGEQCKKAALAGADRCAFHLGPHIGMRAQLSMELIEQLCSILRTGNYATVACRAVGIDTSTLRRWMKSDGALFNVLRERVERARAEGEVRNVALVSQAATTSWQAAAWLLERQYPERWGRTSVRMRDLTADDEIDEPTTDDSDPFAEVDELAAARLRRAQGT